MAYLNDLLGEGEAVVFETHQHRFILFARVLTETILLILLVAAAIITPQAFPQAATLIRIGALALAVIMILSAVGDYLRWKNEQYIVTDRRVIQLRGVFNKNVLDSSLEKINDIEMSQTVFGRMFGYGNIQILTASEDGINRLDYIADPLPFKKAMIDARSRYDHYLDRSPVHAYEAPLNVQDTLLQLAALHDRGILNDAEFEAKKRDLLSRI